MYYRKKFSRVKAGCKMNLVAVRIDGALDQITVGHGRCCEQPWIVLWFTIVDLIQRRRAT
jgi:hypothetical protein